MYARRLSPMIEIKCIKGAQGVTLYRMTEISFRCEIHGANTCTEIGTPADRLGTMVPREMGGGVYTQQTLSLTEYIIRNQNYSEWQLLSSDETLLWPLAAEPEMVQNGTETDHLEHSGGLVPEII